MQHISCMQWPRESGEGMGEEEKGGHLMQVGGAASLGGWQEADGSAGGEFGCYRSWKKKKRKKSAEGRSWRWLPLSPTRRWVHREAEPLFVTTWRRLWWTKKQWREKKKRERDVGWKNWEGWFLANFGLDFLHTQAMKSTVIFRGWRREVFSLITPNLGFCFGWEWSQLFVQSRHHELSNLTVQGYMSRPL